jgi:hypothetical protein
MYFLDIFSTQNQVKTKSSFQFFLIDQKMRNLVLFLPVLLRNGYQLISSSGASLISDAQSQTCQRLVLVLAAYASRGFQCSRFATLLPRFASRAIWGHSLP